MSLKSLELRKKRAGLIEQMRDVHKQAEGRNLTDDEKTKFDKLDADVIALRKDIERQERMEELQKEQAEKRYQSEKKNRDEGGQKSDKPTYRSAFEDMLKRGGKMTDEHYQIIQKRAATDPNVVGDNALGGFLVPEDFNSELEIIMKQYGGMIGVVNEERSNFGGKYKENVLDDTNNEGAIIDEAVEDEVNNLNFTQFNLDSFTYTSRVILITWELMQDNAVNIMSKINAIAGERLGRVYNRHLTVGTGVGQPTGILVGGEQGVVTAAADGIARPEILKLIHSVDPAYRIGPNVRLMFNDQTLSALKSIALGSGDARPLWQPSIRENEPDRLEGYQYVINQNMPDIGAGQKPMAFGDFSKYTMRRVKGNTLVRLNELFATKRSTGFFMYNRMDGGLKVSKAVKYMQNA